MDPAPNQNDEERSREKPISSAKCEEKLEELRNYGASLQFRTHLPTAKLKAFLLPAMQTRALV